MFTNSKIEAFSKRVNLNNKNDTDLPVTFGSEKFCPLDLLKYRNLFIRDGYVKVPNVFTTSEMNNYEKTIINAVEKRMSNFKKHDNPTFYDQQFTQCLNLWEDNPEVRKFTFSEKISRIAAALLGQPRLRLWQDQALFKKPDNRGTSAHQDHPFWPINETNTITAWIPLNNSTLENGSLGYVPGSHISGIRHFSNISTGKELDDFKKRDFELLNHPRLKGIIPTFLEVERGSIVFHHGLTIHLSKPNLTDTTRNTHTIVYMADGSTRGSILGLVKQKHFVVDRKQYYIQPDTEIIGDLTPVVYPHSKLINTPISIDYSEFLKEEGKLPNPTRIKSQL